MQIFNTDYYQLTMALAYLLKCKANEITGFESFVRNIKQDVNINQDYYIFSGEKEIKDFIDIIKKEIKSEELFYQFWKLVSKSIIHSKREYYYYMAKEAFKNIDKDFEFNVIKEGTKVKPFMPVFQYKGPKIFGQLIETKITNIINGRTGYKTFGSNSTIDSIVNDIDYSNEYKEYKNELRKKAREFRDSTSRIILEAGYRRAPSQGIANYASMIAIEENWNGSSNVAAYQEGLISIDSIGGSMAHSFVMSFENEIEAFKAWNDFFPDSTILIDTYDVIEAINTLIENNIKPPSVRIDSGDLKEMSFKVRTILDKAGWNDVKIFISGDMTPELLKEYENENVPFDITMAGTKYVNIGEIKHVNAGFVYKIVEYEKEGKRYFPVKKASGKSNFPGLKKIEIRENDIFMTITDNFKENFNCDFSRIKSESKVIF